MHTNEVPKTLADIRLEAKIAIERLIKATVEEGKESVLILGLESYDNESLSGIEISLKEELLGINGPICDFSVEGTDNCNDDLESMVYTAMEDILEESWNECQ